MDDMVITLSSDVLTFKSKRGGSPSWFPSNGQGDQLKYQAGRMIVIAGET